MKLTKFGTLRIVRKFAWTSVQMDNGDRILWERYWERQTLTDAMHPDWSPTNLTRLAGNPRQLEHLPRRWQGEIGLLDFPPKES